MSDLTTPHWSQGGEGGTNGIVFLHHSRPRPNQTLHRIKKGRFTVSLTMHPSWGCTWWPLEERGQQPDHSAFVA